MALIQGLTVLLIFQLMGEAVSVLLALPVPGPVLGMLFLGVALLVCRQVPSFIEQASSGLLAHLSLLFIPAGVGLMVHFDRLSSEWLPIAVALFVSTLVSLVLTAWLMQWLIGRKRKLAAESKHRD